MGLWEAEMPPQVQEVPCIGSAVYTARPVHFAGVGGGGGACVSTSLWGWGTSRLRPLGGVLFPLSLFFSSVQWGGF